MTTATDTAGPTIFCPSWCTVPLQEHIDELPEWDGLALHYGTLHEAGGVAFRLARATYLDGTPPLEDPALRVDLGETLELTAPQALELAAALLRILQEVCA